MAQASSGHCDKHWAVRLLVRESLRIGDLQRLTGRVEGRREHAILNECQWDLRMLLRAVQPHHRPSRLGFGVAADGQIDQPAGEQRGGHERASEQHAARKPFITIAQPDGSPQRQRWQAGSA